MTGPRVGVLALQGDVREHARVLTDLGAEVVLDLQDEPWGQRRFQVLAPDDVVVEVVQRIAPDPSWSAG